MCNISENQLRRFARRVRHRWPVNHARTVARTGNSAASREDCEEDVADDDDDVNRVIYVGGLRGMRGLDNNEDGTDVTIYSRRNSDCMKK